MYGEIITVQPRIPDKTIQTVQKKRLPLMCSHLIGDVLHDIDVEPPYVRIAFLPTTCSFSEHASQLLYSTQRAGSQLRYSSLM